MNNYPSHSHKEECNRITNPSAGRIIRRPVPQPICHSPAYRHLLSKAHIRMLYMHPVMHTPHCDIKAVSHSARWMRLARHKHSVQWHATAHSWLITKLASIRVCLYAYVLITNYGFVPIIFLCDRLFVGLLQQWCVPVCFVCIDILMCYTLCL